MLTSLFPRFADNIDGARCIGGQNQRMRLRAFEQLLALLDAGGALCLRVEIEIERTARLSLRVRTLTRHHRLDSDDGLLRNAPVLPRGDLFQLFVQILGEIANLQSWHGSPLS